jgi:hypothetical protein
LSPFEIRVVDSHGKGIVGFLLRHKESLGQFRRRAGLIAAAPAMFEACKALITAEGAGIGTEYGNELLERAIAAVREAVKAVQS